jgi:hypothetical protein
MVSSRNGGGGRVSLRVAGRARDAGLHVVPPGGARTGSKPVLLIVSCCDTRLLLNTEAVT